MKYLVIPLLLVLFTACSKNKYEGNWTSPNSYIFLHENKVFDAILDGEYYAGRWNTDKGNVLSLETYGKTYIIFDIEEVSDTKIKLSSTYDGKKHILVKEKTASVDAEFNYWDESKNWWRIPPTQAENSQQICDRAKASMQSAICYLEYRKQQPRPTFRMPALTIPVYLAKNGIQLQRETGNAWKSCFFSEDDAEKGHKMLKYAFEQDFGIDENLQEVDLAISVLHDLYSYMDESKKEYDQFATRKRADYRLPEYNKWQIKSRSPETDEEIRNRTKNCVVYCILFIRSEGLIRAYTPYEKLPLPMTIRDSGVTLSKTLSKNWIDVFYDEKDAQKGYNMLERALFSGIEIPKNLKLKDEELASHILQEVSVALDSDAVKIKK